MHVEYNNDDVDRYDRGTVSIRCRRLVAVAVVVGVYLVGYWGWWYRYAYADDYSTIWSASWVPYFRNAYLACGRPLFGVLQTTASRFVHSFDALSYFRGLSFVLLVCFSVSLTSLLKRSGRSVSEAVFIVLLMTLTPSFAVYIGWAHNFVYILSGILSIWAGVIVLSQLQEPFNRRALWRSLVACFLMFLAFCIYQPLVGFFFFPLLFAYTSPKRKSVANWLRDSAYSLLFYAANLILYYVIYKVAVMVSFPSGYRVAERGNLGFDLCAQGWDFVRGPLLVVFSQWLGVRDDITPWVVIIPLFMFFAVGFVCLFAIHFKRRILSFGMFFAIFGISQIHLLLLNRSYSPFRVLTTLYAFVMFFVALGVLRILGSQLKAKGQCWVATVLGAIIVLNAVATNWHFREGIVRPAKEELARFEDAVRDACREEKSRPKAIAYISLSDHQATLSPLPRRYEFGDLSSHYNWVPDGMISILLDELYGPENNAHFMPRFGLVYMEAIPQDIDIGIPTIDANRVICGRSIPRVNVRDQVVRETPYGAMGVRIDYANGWYDYTGLGLFYDYQEPFGKGKRTFHVLWGRMMSPTLDSEQGFIEAYMMGIGDIRFSRQIYPDVFVYANDEWQRRSISSF
jgi:hypothetical protein